MEIYLQFFQLSEPSRIEGNLVNLQHWFYTGELPPTRHSAWQMSKLGLEEAFSNSNTFRTFMSMFWQMNFIDLTPLVIQ